MFSELSTLRILFSSHVKRHAWSPSLNAKLISTAGIKSIKEIGLESTQVTDWQLGQR